MLWIYVLAAIIVLVVAVRELRGQPTGSKEGFPWFWVAFPTAVFSAAFELHQVIELRMRKDPTVHSGVVMANDDAGLWDVSGWSSGAVNSISRSDFESLVGMGFVVFVLALGVTVWSWRRKRI